MTAGRIHDDRVDVLGKGRDELLGKLSDRPALLVWPTKDIAFREPERKRWEQLFPNHRTVILEGAGHFIQEDAPDEIVNAIESWSPAG